MYEISVLHMFIDTYYLFDYNHTMDEVVSD